MDPERLQRLCAGALSEIGADIDFEVVGPTEHPDTFDARLDGQPVVAVWLGVGWPRQVEAVLARAHPPDLVAAPELSPGARDRLTAAGVSWFDETGAARIVTPRVRVLVDTRRAAPKSPRKNLGWTPATLAVCEALLLGAQGTVARVSDRTGLAASTVSTSLKLLQTEHLISAEAQRGRHARRVVDDGEQLLDAYAAAAARLRSPQSIRVGVLWRDPHRGAEQLGALWETQGARWSATSALAADVLAPLLTDVVPLEIYVQAQSLADLRQVARQAGLSEAAGGRLVLRPFPTPAQDTLSDVVSGVRVMPWPRVYADLRSTGVRGEEAAEHLRTHRPMEPSDA